MSKKPPLLKLRDRLNNLETRTREAIFLHKLRYDLKIAAVEANIKLQIYDVEVDNAGYDIIVDSGEMQRRFQVKTRILPKGATKWTCHSQLFCPSPEEAAYWQVPEWNNRDAWGYNGGFIVMDIKWGDSGAPPTVTYQYCDLAVLMALRDGFAKDGRRTILAKKTLRETTIYPFERRRRRFSLQKSLLVKPKTHAALLSLMGFNVWMGPDLSSAYRNAYSSKHRGALGQQDDNGFMKAFFHALSLRVE